MELSQVAMKISKEGSDRFKKSTKNMRTSTIDIYLDRRGSPSHFMRLFDISAPFSISTLNRSSRDTLTA